MNFGLRRDNQKKLSFKNASIDEFFSGKKQFGVSQLGCCEIQISLNLLF